MAIRTLNPAVPNVKRPFRIEDLQEIWDGLNNAVASDSIGPQGEPRLIFVSGFVEDMQSGILSAGVVAYGGKLYYYDPDYSSMVIGDTLCLETVEGETRIFEDGLSRPFYLNNRAVEESDVTTSNFINCGEITEQFLRQASATRIGDFTIVNSMLANNSVAERNLRNESVTNRTVADNAIKSRNLDIPVKNLSSNGYGNPYTVGIVFETDELSKAISDFVSPLSDEDINPPVFVSTTYVASQAWPNVSLHLDTALQNANYPNRIAIVFENSIKTDFLVKIRNPLDGSKEFSVRVASAATDYGKGVGVLDLVKYRCSNGLYAYLPTHYDSYQ
jgi:hypothetical protein